MKIRRQTAAQAIMPLKAIKARDMIPAMISPMGTPHMTQGLCVLPGRALTRKTDRVGGVASVKFLKILGIVLLIFAATVGGAALRLKEVFFSPNVLLKPYSFGIRALKRMLLTPFLQA